MPKIIALCGNPQSGKNEVGRILHERYGAILVDDGEPLRLAAPMLFRGVTLEDCYTQKGKTKPYPICGNHHPVRKLLGDVGQMLEDKYGEFYLPEQALLKMQEFAGDHLFVMTACRKRQGFFWREQGGVVWEVDRGMPASPYAFDWFDPTAVTGKINNFGDIDDLERNISEIMEVYLGE